MVQINIAVIVVVVVVVVIVVVVVVVVVAVLIVILEDWFSEVWHLVSGAAYASSLFIMK